MRAYPPYYQGFFENYGFQPARGDNLAYEITWAMASAAIERLSRLAERTPRGIIGSRSARRIWNIGMMKWSVSTSCSTKPWHTCLISSPGRGMGLQASLEQFRQIIDPELVLFAEVDGETVGWFPGYSQYQ